MKCHSATLATTAPESPKTSMEVLGDHASRPGQEGMPSLPHLTAAEGNPRREDAEVKAPLAHSRVDLQAPNVLLHAVAGEEWGGQDRAEGQGSLAQDHRLHHHRRQRQDDLPDRARQRYPIGAVSSATEPLQ